MPKHLWVASAVLGLAAVGCGTVPPPTALLEPHIPDRSVQNASFIGNPGATIFHTQCVACHVARSRTKTHYDRLLDATTNTLTKTLAGNKAHLARFLNTNAPMRPDGSPAPELLNPTQAAVVATYLWNHGQGTKVSLPMIRLSGNSNRGTQLFGQYCSVCHGVNGSHAALVQPSVARTITDLVGSKARLAGFIQQMAPMTNTGGKDPKTNLTAQQSADLAAYLWNLAHHTPKGGPSPGGLGF